MKQRELVLKPHSACVDLDLGNCQSAIEEVSARILKETGYEAGKMLPYACNATNEEEVGATVAQIINDFDHIDVLVTCAGICIHCEAETTGLAAWRKVLGVNLDGTFLFAREVGKHMLEKHIKGSMVFVASGAATHPPRPQAQVSYNASKAGVKQMAVSLATEWAGRGIRVNTLSPGYMTTPLMPVTDLQMEWLTQIPMGTTPQCPTVRFLLTSLQAALPTLANFVGLWLVHEADNKNPQTLICFTGLDG